MAASPERPPSARHGCRRKTKKAPFRLSTRAFCVALHSDFPYSKAGLKTLQESEAPMKKTPMNYLSCSAQILAIFVFCAYTLNSSAQQSIDSEYKRNDSKTGKFSLDVELYNNLKEDPFQAQLRCRQTDFEYKKKADGSFEEVILFETANSWVLMGLTQTPQNPKGAEVTYYPAFGYSDPPVNMHKEKPNKVDTSLQLIVSPVIEEDPKKPGHALNKNEYKVVMKIRKHLEEFKASDTRTIEKQVIEKSVEIINPVGYGALEQVAVGPDNNKIKLNDPAPVSYNTRNLFSIRDLFFSTDLELQFYDGKKYQRILCKICTPLTGTLFVKGCGKLDWESLKTEASKIDPSLRGPLHVINRGKLLKAGTNVGSVLNVQNSNTKENK